MFTYSFAPKFKINDRMAIYARVAKGYRPGGPNVVAPGPGVPTTYESDSTLNYELGMKGENETGTFSFDAAVFHIDWDDIQLLAVIKAWASTRSRGADSDGVEASLQFRPIDALRLSLTGAYTDAKLTEELTCSRSAGAKGIACPIRRRPATPPVLTMSGRWPTVAARTSALRSAICQKCPQISMRLLPLPTNRSATCPRTRWSTCGRAIDFGKFSLELFGRNLTNDDGKTSVSVR